MVALGDRAKMPFGYGLFVMIQGFIEARSSSISFVLPNHTPIEIPRHLKLAQFIVKK